MGRHSFEKFPHGSDKSGSTTVWHRLDPDTLPQFAGNTVVFWGEAGTGFAGSVHPPRDASPVVRIEGVYIDSKARHFATSDTGAPRIRLEDATEDARDLGKLAFDVDFTTGRISIEEDRTPDPRAEWVGSQIDGIVLDRLHGMTLSGMGLDPDQPAPFELEAPGVMVPYSRVFRRSREDAYPKGYETYLALDYHCPDCDCGEVIVQFVDVSRGVTGDSEVGHIALHLTADITALDASRKELQSTGDPSLLHDLSESYFLRHRSTTRLRERGKKVRDLMAVRRAEAKATESAPGRNDPCPCGSGKKYKKCCGTERPR